MDGFISFKRELRAVFERMHGIVLETTMMQSIWESSGRPSTFATLQQCNCFECYRDMIGVLRGSRKPMQPLRVCRSIDRYFGDTRLMDALLFGYFDDPVICSGDIKTYVRQVYRVDDEDDMCKILVNVLAFWDFDIPSVAWTREPHVSTQLPDIASWILALQRDFMSSWNVCLGRDVCVKVCAESLDMALGSRRALDRALDIGHALERTVMREAKVKSVQTANRLHACVGGLDLPIGVVRFLDDYFGAHHLENLCILKKTYATKDMTTLVSDAYRISERDAMLAISTVVLFRIGGGGQAGYNYRMTDPMDDEEEVASVAPVC